MNPALYAIGLGNNYGAAFHDITTGNNTNKSTHTQFFAVPGYDLCTGWGTPTGTNLINLLTAPILSGAATLMSESCLPTNGVIDPGETVTISLALTNVGVAGTTHLTANLQASAAVLDPSGPQTYGAVKRGGAAASQAFTFTASGECGQTIAAVWQLQDGTANLGTVTVNFPLGALVPVNTFSQGFDGVSAPALPAGWSNMVSGAEVNWVTSAAAADSAPNSAFATDVGSSGLAYLIAPAISVLSPSAQLTFRQNYVLESVTTSTHHHGTTTTTTTYYDGGVLEIAIGGGSFTDILSAGGSFVTGGYNGTLYNNSGNPLGGRAAWGGNSGGWITTTVNLPAGAAGQKIQLRWGCGTDEINEYPVTGWYVDTIALRDAYYSCCSDSADLSVSQAAAPPTFVPGQNGTYTVTVSNAGPDLAAEVVLTDALPPGVTFVSASPGCVLSSGAVIYNAGTLGSGASDTISVTVLPGGPGFVTNAVTVSSVTADSNAANNTVFLVTAVSGGNAPAITNQPAGAVVLAGASVTFQVGASGSGPLSYQWYFNSTNLVASTASGQLTLSNVQPVQAGNYSAVVSNLAGLAASLPAALRVLVAPALDPASVVVTGAGFSVSLQSVAGLNYTLQYKNELTEANWTPIAASTVTGTGGVIVLQDSTPPSARFYEVVCN